MADVGLSCAKTSYTRETILPSCAGGNEYDEVLHLSLSPTTPVATMSDAFDVTWVLRL